MSAERACPIYREAGSLTFHASGPDREPEMSVLAPDGWRVEEGELAFEESGRQVRLGPEQAALSARCHYFGLSVWWEPATETAKPRAKAKKKRGGVNGS